MAQDERPLRQTDGQEQTGAQLASGTQGEKLSNPLPKSYATYRQIRKDPTVALARAFAIAPVVDGGWSVESEPGAPAERVAFVKQQFLPIREPLLKRTMEGCIDFGWQPFEKVFEVDPSGDMIRLKRLKPLLHDITSILIEPTGKFMGFRQQNKVTGQDEDLDLDYSLLFNMETEGDNHYGESRLENIRGVYTNWQDVNKAASRYDRKIAGGHFVVYFPEGKSWYNGKEMDNHLIAKDLMESLEAGGSITIPQKVVRSLEDMNNQATVGVWKADIVSGGGPAQYGFDERLVYFDKLKCRGVLVPERSVLEAAMGTRADAYAHGENSLTLRSLERNDITRAFNWHCVDQLLAQNWGEEARGTVRLCPAPLDEAQKTWLRDVYKLLLANPVGFMEEVESLDRSALKDAIGLPVRPGAIDPATLTKIPTANPEAVQEPGVQALANTVADLYNASIADAA